MVSKTKFFSSKAEKTKNLVKNPMNGGIPKALRKPITKRTAKMKLDVRKLDKSRSKKICVLCNGLMDNVKSTVYIFPIAYKKDDIKSA